MKEKARIDYIPIPKKLQDVIPVKTIYLNGIFRLKNGRFSKSYRIKDINYQAVGKEEKRSYSSRYADFLSGFESEFMYEITVSRRKLNLEEYNNKYLLKPAEDGMEEIRNEYNKIISDIVEESNTIYQEIYLTLSTDADSYELAKSYFDKAAISLQNSLVTMDSMLEDIDGKERLEIFNDFNNSDKSDIDLKDMIKGGRDARTYISPGYFACEHDYIKLGKKYARTLVVTDYSTYIKDNVISRIIGDIPNPVMFSITSDPVPTDEAVENAEQRLTKINKNIDQWKKKQHSRHMPYDEIPYDYQVQRDEIKKFINNLREDDMRLLYSTMTILHTADTLEELDRDTDAVIAAGKTAGCKISVLEYRQFEGLHTALPYGLRCIDISRIMLSGSMLAFTPFYVEEIQDYHGSFYGKNQISKHLIMADETKLNNANMMILAVPGSGKSVFAKLKMGFEALADPDTDIIVIDPEREYGSLVKAYGGEVIKISAESPHHINLMDINEDYSIEEDKPVTLKSQFIMSIFEHILNGITPAEKTIIDRCVINVYKSYVEAGYKGEAPTFETLYDEIKSCDEPEARDIALAMELFVKGSLNTFAKKTNVNTDARIQCYDLWDMDEQLMPVGLEVVLDSILNRVSSNRFSGRKTIIIVEELHMYLKYQYSAEFFYKLWKRIRKCNGRCVGVTQNVPDLMTSDTARTMLSNSELVVLLKQSEDDLEDIRKLCHISDEQLNYVRNPLKGCGLLKIGKTVIPFDDRIPKDTKIYELVNTDSKEKSYAGN